MAEKNLTEISSGIKIVVAGTIASGKTTLLGAISTYKTDSVKVTAFSPSGTDSFLYNASSKFTQDAYNTFNNTSERQVLDKNPWLDATLLETCKKEICLDVVSGKDHHIISFCDFAGETFLDAFNKVWEEQGKTTGAGAGNLRERRNIQEEVGERFKSEIENANMVLIVVSSKDILDFLDLLESDSTLAKRMQFAYSTMTAKAKELQEAKKTEGKYVEVLFVITQCDQYKALISNNRDLLKNGLYRLIMGEPATPINIIYTASVYQTELKKIGTKADESIYLKFCPVSERKRNKEPMRKDQPCSLGIKTLMERICSVSEKEKAERGRETAEKEAEDIRKIKEEEERLQKELALLNEKLDNLEDELNGAIKNAEEMMEKMKRKKDDKNHSDSFKNLVDACNLVKTALYKIQELRKNCGNTMEDLNAVKKALEDLKASGEAELRSNAIKMAKERLSAVEKAMKSAMEALDEFKKKNNAVSDLRRTMENCARIIGGRTF